MASFYIAGKWQERDRVKEVYRTLRSMGHKITCNWTDHEEPKEDILEWNRKYAFDDILGVKKCDIFLMILEKDYNYKGAWVEMGMAIAYNKPIAIIGHAGDSCLFTNLPAVKVFDDLLDFWQFLPTINMTAWNNGTGAIMENDD